jgi:hypothetical protein
MEFDRALRLVSNEQRRQILFSLLDNNPLDHATVTIAGADEAETAEATLVLHHRHLPKLAHAGAIEWDVRTDTIRRGPTYPQLRPVLELVGEYRGEPRDSWRPTPPDATTE